MLKIINDVMTQMLKTMPPHDTECRPMNILTSDTNAPLTNFNLTVKYDENNTFEISASGNAEIKGQSYTYETLVKINKDL